MLEQIKALRREVTDWYNKFNTKLNDLEKKVTPPEEKPRHSGCNLSSPTCLKGIFT